MRRAETAVVVGGGAAGLAAALALHDAGVGTTLLEASDKAGGKLGTLREAGFLLETSAIGLLDREGELQPLCRRLGLTLLPAREGAKERWVLRDGRVHALPGSLPALIGTRLLSLGEKLALAGEPFRRPRRASEAVGAASSAEASSAEESVEAFFARRLGPGGPFLASALQTGIYAGDPAQLEVGAAFPSLARLERAHGSLVRGAAREARGRRQARLAMGLPALARLSSFRGGLQELTAALARELGPGVQTRAHAVSLHRAGQRFRIELVREGQRAEIDADAVVVALPAPQAAALVQPLDAALATRLDELRAAPIALVHIGVEDALLPRPARGFGLLAPGSSTTDPNIPAVQVIPLPDQWATGIQAVGLLVFVASLLLGAISLALRYQRSRGTERLQMKWMVYACALLIASAPTLALGTFSIFLFAAALLPVAAGIAILRYRLYEIDVLIRRTLIYAAVSATLLLTYVAGLAALESLLAPFTSGNSLAVALSTLVAVALFQPARRRIASSVDRRFYRARYDAENTLDAFASRLREQIDLAALERELIGIARDTMHPTHASVWLRRGR